MEPSKQLKARMHHSVMLEERAKCVITGVVDIAGFHEGEIILRLEEAVMIINGEKLRIGSLRMEEGKLDICGNVSSIIYENPHAKMRSILGIKRK